NSKFEIPNSRLTPLLRLYSTDSTPPTLLHRLCSSDFTPLPGPAVRARSNPDTAGSVVPTAPPPVAFPESDRHSDRTCHNRRLRSGIALRQSTPKAVDRWSTSTSITLSCRRWRPYRPDPASPQHRARGCRLPPPAPGPP